MYTSGKIVRIELNKIVWKLDIVRANYGVQCILSHGVLEIQWSLSKANFLWAQEPLSTKEFGRPEFRENYKNYVTEHHINACWSLLSKTSTIRLSYRHGYLIIAVAVVWLVFYIFDQQYMLWSEVQLTVFRLLIGYYSLNAHFTQRWSADGS